MISWPVARAAFRERATAIPIILAGLMTLSSLRTPPDQVFGGFNLPLLTFFTLLLGAGLLSDELENGHAQLVLLRPLTRAQWYGGRFAGAALLLLAGLTAAFAASVVTAVFQGRFAASQLWVLPVGFLWSVSWLSVVVAAGAVARGWTNAGLVLLAAVVWAVLLGLSRFASPALADALQVAGKYLGPQQPLPVLAFEPVAYDLLWLFGAWLVGVLLFNRRELARRRS